MKHAFIATMTALSLCVSASAMAKDLNAVDIFIGDFAGVVTIDFDKLVANKMVGNAISENIGNVEEAGDLLSVLKEAGIDYSKDIDTVAIASNDRGHVCVVVDGKVPLTVAVEKMAAKQNMTAADYKSLKIYTDSAAKNSSVLLSDKRLLDCETMFDIKGMIDNAQSEKPKVFKNNLSSIAKAYNMSSSSADVRAGGKMTSFLKSKGKEYKLDGAEGKSISVSDVESGSLSISFSKGLNVTVNASAKDEATAAVGAEIIWSQISTIVSDPSLEELGLGFVKSAIKVVPDKKNVKATVSLSEDNMKTIVALLSGAAIQAQPPAKK